jgi:hypothetical protein
MAVEMLTDDAISDDDIIKLCNKYAVPHAVIVPQQQQLSADAQQARQAFTTTNTTTVQYWMSKLSTGNTVIRATVSTSHLYKHYYQFYYCMLIYFNSFKTQSMQLCKQ